jgi:hypothetical protein
MAVFSVARNPALVPDMAMSDESGNKSQQGTAEGTQEANSLTIKLAEGVGFEPTAVPKPANAFLLILVFPK